MTNLIVAAIDFGTTFSGFAFSLLHEYKKDPLKISTKSWTTGSGGLVSLKTSTCVLFDPTEKFNSFGYDAEEKYSNLALDDNHHDWYYFRRFKMMLYNKMDLTRETLIEDDKGKKMEAIKVFSTAIGYLKDQMLTNCKKQMTGIEESDITWVLTVPAIWDEKSKQFMREAAEEAGICRDKLVLALEPASLYCMYLPLHKDSENSTFGVFKSGEKYIVVDAGGGTIDITVYEVRENGSVKELHKANGGDWGGTKVDELFTSLLVNIVGKGVMEAFSSENKYDFLDLMRDFEIKKRTISPDLNDKVTIKVPISLSETFRKKNPGINITDVTLNSEYREQLTWKGDKIRIEARLVKSLFDGSCKQIVNHLKELFRHSAVKDVVSILLVGGFAESLMLQSTIREAFKNKNVIIPQEAGLAVLKGAALYGHQPQKISGRVCRYTYGVKIVTTFDNTIHPKLKKILHNNIEYCDDIFSIHVRVGQIVEVGEPQVKQTYEVTEPDQTSIGFKIYTSNNKEPTYTTDEGCTYLGTLTTDMPDTSKGMDRGATVHMTFSGTEIAVTAVDRDNPERAVTTKVDFLG
ncbi:heat shock 70 kDa protein 12A-like [Crassostrea angulata]|uniref:heat shock 70 kDa protein 12A-like n=1 Tax=Magallana angulata TaxID=2784310 RepID=UPI0022B2188E|nr:heat shock 70 kDa protein 12A-like [Crassostrea angulata]